MTKVWLRSFFPGGLQIFGMLYFLHLLRFRLPRTLPTSLKSNQLDAVYNEQSRAHIFMCEPESDYVAFRVQNWWPITRALLQKTCSILMSKAQRRATKEYYPPHLTGHGSRGLGLLDIIFFGHDPDEDNYRKSHVICLSTIGQKIWPRYDLIWFMI